MIPPDLRGPGEDKLRPSGLSSPSPLAWPSFLARALLGREGGALVAEDLRSFYERAYLHRNPTLDADDAPYKARLLGEVAAEARLGAARSLVEVGCGSGALLDEMRRRLGAARAVGVDYSPGIAAAGRSRHGHAVVRADGAALPFATGAFEVAYFADVLEHVLDPIGFLREVGRVGRRIAFLIPIEAGLVSTPIYVTRRLRGKWTNFEQYGHIWRWSRPEVLRLLGAAGIRVDAYRCYQPDIKTEGMNRMGRFMETLRWRTARLSGVAAEALFGTAALVGVGAGLGGAAAARG